MQGEPLFSWAPLLTGTTVEDLGALAEVDLRRLAEVELQNGRHLWVSGLEACEEAAHRGDEPVKPWLRTRAPWMVVPWIP